jgi:putative ABC transport system permease protein
VVLIIGVFTILAQLEYMKTADLGFSRELIINIPNMGFAVDKRQVFKDKLLTNPNVMKVSFGLVPGERIQPFPGYVEYQNIKIKPSIVWTDPDYFEVMDIEILEGRNFSWDREGDLWRMDHQEENAMRVIINKAATKAFEIKSPFGEILTYEAGFRYEIIGVVEDFHFFSLHHKINPTFYFWHRSAAGVSIKILPHDIQGTIKIIKNEYESIFPNLTFEFSFLDDTYNQQYEDDERFSKIIRNFAIVAILIACLGLFGLSSFMAARRTKEIGIRKAMGASVRTVFLLLSREFVKWVVLSVIIACPVAWIIMNRWLQSFAFRTNINWWIFAITILIAFSIAFITVAWQSLKTARTNPVEALRYE